MPKYLKYSPRSTEYALNRSQRARVFGYNEWFDPFSYIHGTAPEKRVYEALSRRGIPFLFLNEQTYEIPEIELIKEYQSDFILPDQRVIIEVQGSYWHSKPDAIENDAFKFAIYQMKGWRVLAWWDYEIEANVNALFSRDLPGLGGYTGSTTTSELPVVSRKKQDTSQGIRTLNYKRGQRLSYRKKSIKLKSKNKISTYGGYTINAK